MLATKEGGVNSIAIGTSNDPRYHADFAQKRAVAIASKRLRSDTQRYGWVANKVDMLAVKGGKGERPIHVAFGVGKGV